MDCLEFLSDVVPRTVQLKNSKQRNPTAYKTPNNNDTNSQTNHINNDKEDESLSEMDRVRGHGVDVSAAATELNSQDVEMASDDSKGGPDSEKH